MDSVTLANIRDAAAILRPVAHETPILTSRAIHEIVGAQVFLKCENFQRVGAFKFRGAYHAIAKLASAERQKPIIAVSSGNHAQGVALACKLRGLQAHIVMPEPMNPLKREAVRGYHATAPPSGRTR